MSVRRERYDRQELLSLKPPCTRPPAISDRVIARLRQLSIWSVPCPLPRSTNIVKTSSKKSVTSSVTFHHLNIRSIRSPEKFDAFEPLLTTPGSTKLFGLTETFLDDSLPTRLFTIDGYTTYRKDRVSTSKKGGGGILFYLPSHISAKLVDHSDPPNSYESLFIDLSLAGRRVLVGIVYRPPQLPASKTRELFESIEGLLDSSTKLDLMLCSPSSGYSMDKAIDMDISDHRLCKTVATYRCALPPKTAKFRAWNHSPLSDFVDSVGRHTFRFLPFRTINNLDDTVNQFVDGLSDIVDQHFPYRTRRVRHRDYPWMTGPVKAVLRQRNVAYRVMVDSWTPAVYLERRREFKVLKKRFNSVLLQEKSLFFKRNAMDQKRLWSVLGQLLKKDRAVITPVDISPSTLNEYYVQMGQHGVPHPTPQPVLGRSQGVSIFEFQPVEPESVRFHLKEMAAKRKSAGPEGIPSRLLGSIVHLLTAPLAHLINHSMSAGLFPNKFKLAEVTPIPKTADASTPDQFRPISLISNLSKVFEKVVQRQLVDHIASHDILSDRQSGFRPGHSCETLLLKVTEKWKKAIDRGQFTAVVFLDLQKAFDSVRHDLLLERLVQIGCATVPLQWFHSYLVGRQQKVRVGESLSPPLPVRSGVPQGSVLGPLLFALYVNPLLKSYGDQGECEIECFADDTAVSVTGNNEGETVVTLNRVLEGVSSWFAAQSLPLNEKKSVAMLIRGERKATAGDTLVSINGTALPWSSSTRYLGVIVDQHLKWKDHVKKVARSVTFGIAELNRAKQGLTFRQRVNLYHAVIEPHFDYCSPVWSSASKSLLETLLVKQRMAVRAITNYSEPVRENTLKRLGIVPLAERWQKQLAVWLYKIRNPAGPIIPNYMKTLVEFKTITTYNLRRPNSVVAKADSKTGEGTLAFRLRLLFRNLEHLILSSASLSIFKASISCLTLSE